MFRNERLLGSIPATIDGCPILRVFCEGWDTAGLPSSLLRVPQIHTAPVQQRLSVEAPPSPLSSRPKRTRISYFAPLATTTCAALREESRI
jgi:hypothetical protein